jgi:hypothetical protein
VSLINRLKSDLDSALNSKYFSSQSINEEEAAKTNLSETLLKIIKFIEQLNQQVMNNTSINTIKPASSVDTIFMLVEDNKRLALEFILDQLKTLKLNTENMMAMLKSTTTTNTNDEKNNVINDDHESLKTEVLELKEQIAKQTSLLATKREQIVSLLAVLKVY